MKRNKIAVINGPNLGQLGNREPEYYGSFTYSELCDYCTSFAAKSDMDLQIYQNDVEGEIVKIIHQQSTLVDGIILNAAAYTHTSVAIRDAVSALSIPIVEVHISNPHAREDFRKKNLLSDVVTASVSGFGISSYRLAIDGLMSLLKNI